MFEGYKVPECTEKEVRKMLKEGDCHSGSVPCMSQCSKCIFFDTPIMNGVTQRYYDHRWPKKVAVHCPTEEEWDRVIKKEGMSRHHMLEWSSFAEPCIILGHPYYFNTEKADIGGWLKLHGYKIISAAEFLGEGVWKDRAVIMPESDYLHVNFTKPIISLIVGGSGIILNTEEDMNASIEKVFGNSRTSNEVKMVDKYFGNVPVNNLTELLLEKHKEEIFKKAAELKKEEEEAKKD